ncbi:MAG: MBL fold metallo-hydrolase [Gammaproteobacteria bacterium]|nr:MBL fold metallo-hydrolase [Gammaproteobacteria bacterium]
MKRLAIIASTASLLAAPVALAADDVEMKSFDMGNGIWMIVGQGGNLGVSIGEDGIFLIDDQYAPLTPAIRAEIAELAGEERAVDFLVNTHVHGDHTGGNENFGKGGTLIVAHENVRKRMTTDAFRESFMKNGGKSLEDALPTVTFNDRISFHLNGETLRTRHYPNAHTDGDSVIFFDGANVVHTGDLFFNIGYPFVDRGRGGSVMGLLDALEDLLGRVDADTRIIPGHGEASDREGLVAYRNMIRTVAQRVEEQVDKGKSLEEIQAMKLTSDFDERWNWQFINGEKFIATIHAELTQ